MHRNQKGVSLLETIIGLAIGLIVIGAGFEFFVKQIEVHISQQQLSRMQQNGRLGVDVMLREIRMAGFDSTGTAGAGVIVANANAFQFSMDLNEDGDVNDSGEIVMYAINDVDQDGDLDLARSLDGVNMDLVSNNIESLTFVYTLTDGSSTSTPSDVSEIRKVEISMSSTTARADRNYSANGGHRNWTVTRATLLRNLNL